MMFGLVGMCIGIASFFFVSLRIYFANGLIFLIMCVSEHKKARLFIKLKLHLG